MTNSAVKTMLLLLAFAAGRTAFGGEEVPPEWNPAPEEIEAAPETLKSRQDEYTFRYEPGPSRAMLEAKPKIYSTARRFFKGDQGERAKARKELVSMGLATARFLYPLAGLMVPKSERPVPDPEDWDPPLTPEDEALEVIKDIQDRVLKTGKVDAIMQFFACAANKVLEVDAALVDRTHEFRIHRVHPIPALWRAGTDLGCDMAVVDPEAPAIKLMLPVLLDITIRGEDVRWFLGALARLGKFETELAPEVEGPVTLRVRADGYREAFTAVAERAGYSVEESDKRLLVKK